MRTQQIQKSENLSLPPTSHLFLSTFSPPLRKEVQPFLLCLVSLCVVLGVFVFPPLPLDETFCHLAFAHQPDVAFSHQMAETFSHQLDETFSHPFSFLCVGTFSRPCPLPGVLSVRCVCCKE